MPQLEQSIQRRALLYDKGGEEHYNLISALHKSMRDSDPDAAVYWLARMLEAGEDPLFVARRLVRFASEDIGNADPQALGRGGRRQGGGALHRHARGQHRAGAGGDLSGDRAQEQRRLHRLRRRRGRRAHAGRRPVPLHLRNAPTKLMKQLEYGKGYQYAHDEPEGIAAMDCLPASLAGTKYYQPTERGFEKEIKRRLDGWEQIKKQRRRPVSRGPVDSPAGLQATALTGLESAYRRAVDLDPADVHESAPPVPAAGMQVGEARPRPPCSDPAAPTCRRA